jgi:hypothetical protein
MGHSGVVVQAWAWHMDMTAELSHGPVELQEEGRNAGQPE